MPDYLREQMLKAVRDTPLPASLNAVAKQVYQCALSKQTLGEAAGKCGLTTFAIQKIVEELVAANVVRVCEPEQGHSQAGKTTPEQQHQFNAFADTETFIERLDTLFDACRQKNYYDLLGVEPDTPRSSLRTRYFELSKQFHPDRAFSQEAKERKDMMAVVFQKLTLAYETLSNRNKKAEYDASISDELELRAMEKSLSAAVEERQSLVPEKRGVSSNPPSSKRSVPSSSKPLRSTPPTKNGVKTVSSVIPQASSSVPSGKQSSRPATPRGSTPPNVKRFQPSVAPKPKADKRRQEMKRKLAGRAMAELLSRRSRPPKGMINLDKTLDDAKLALDQERFSDAVNLVRAVMKQFPDNPVSKEILNKAGRGLAQSQVRLHMRRSRYATREGAIEKAKWHLEQALVIDQKNTDARHELAILYLEKEKNAQQALMLMKEVIVLGGHRAKYFGTLGEIFLDIGDLDRARDAFKRAMQLEPDNREIKKKLKLCSR